MQGEPQIRFLQVAQTITPARLPINFAPSPTGKGKGLGSSALDRG